MAVPTMVFTTPYYGIYYPNNDKLHEGFVSKQTNFIF